MAIKTAGLAQQIRIGRVSGNTAIFSALLYTMLTSITGLRLSAYLENENAGDVTGLCGNFDDNAEDPITHMDEAFDFTMRPSICHDKYNPEDYMMCPGVSPVMK